MDFGSQLPPLEPSKSLFFLRKTRFFQKNTSFEVGIDFWCHLYANLLPFTFQNPSKSYKKQVPRGIQKLIDVGFDFWSIWAPFWEPSWNHVAHQDASKTLLRRSKTLPRRFTKLSRRPEDTKTPSRGPKTPPRPPKTPQGRQKPPQGMSKSLVTS